MKVAVAKKESIAECYNTEFVVTSVHSDFALAYKKSEPLDIILEIDSNVEVGHHINNDGKPWQSNTKQAFGGS